MRSTQEGGDVTPNIVCGECGGGGGISRKDLAYFAACDSCYPKIVTNLKVMGHYGLQGWDLIDAVCRDVALAKAKRAEEQECRMLAPKKERVM